MKINQLIINEYQVIRQAKLENLKDVVTIAGPNGVGKTKIKDAICFIFQNGGNPPAKSSVVLEATNEEEEKNWGSKTITLPHSGFLSWLSKPRKKIKTHASLIQIDSSRQIDTLQFNQIYLSQIGNPEEETVNQDYGYSKVTDRFQDICQSLQKIKAKLITSYGLEAEKKFTDNNEKVELNRKDDFTKKFEEIFYNLLYPKQMMPIRHDSTTIQYMDEEGVTRNFSELSSGEKEVVVLAFDILLQNPTDSVILIDEPEIHLHPELSFRLIKVLQSIGERNQLFLFTHSTDIISNSFEKGIYFIRPKKTTDGNQTIRIDLDNIDDLLQIPNLRETIGMLSLGKRLLFVEGKSTSIDRNVFATIAKSSKSDIAIVPSESCHNINNLATMCDILEKGIFGIELFMVRDRDSLTDEEIENFTKKSKNKLIFLPYYHIENAFLEPEAILFIAQKLKVKNNLTIDQIKEIIIELARNQINQCIRLYVSNEVRFKAGNLDITPTVTLSSTASTDEIIKSFNTKKNGILDEYTNKFSDDFIAQRVVFWKQKLENSLSNGWSNEAKKLFYGKSLFGPIQQQILGTKNISLWEHMINEKNTSCENAVKELKTIINNL